MENSPFRKFKFEYSRFGLIKSLLSLMDSITNIIIRIDCLKIRILKKEEFDNFNSIENKEILCRYAEYEDLIKMQLDGIWEISEKKISNYFSNDLCILSFLNSKLTGYVWISLKNEMAISENFKIKFPKNFIYCYASYTLPQFRGFNFMLHRRKFLLNSPFMKDKSGIISYVKFTNWSSLKGQNKSKYNTVGIIWFIRIRKHYFVFLSNNLKRIGIKKSLNNINF